MITSGASGDRLARHVLRAIEPTLPDTAAAAPLAPGRSVLVEAAADPSALKLAPRTGRTDENGPIGHLTIDRSVEPEALRLGDVSGGGIRGAGQLADNVLEVVPSDELEPGHSHRPVGSPAGEP